MTNSKNFGRWYVSAQLLAHEYSAARDKINGFDRESSVSRQFFASLHTAIEKAVFKGELRAYGQSLGPIISPGADAYENGVVMLDHFCEWAQGVLPDCPKDAAVLAEKFGFDVGSALSAPAVSKAAPAQSHTTKAHRSDKVGEAIKAVQKRCTDPNNTAQVWTKLEALADDEAPPFLAATEDGLKYRKNGGDAYLTQNALRQRLKRAAKKVP